MNRENFELKKATGRVKNVLLVMLLGLFFISPNLNAQDANKKFIGNWEYSNNYDLPYEFQSGNVKIFLEKNKLKAKLEFEYMDMDVDDLEVKDNVLNIELFVDGSYVDVDLKLKDKKLVGHANVDGMSVPIELVRSKKKS